LAAELTCASPTRTAWVGVYSLDLSQPSTRDFLKSRGIAIFPQAGRAYRIRTFEVDRKFIDPPVHIGETELINPVDTFAFDDEELVFRLHELGIEVERLEPPFKSAYPI